MDNSRQEAFRKLRGPCVDLSSTGLKFRGHQASPNEVLGALRSVHDVLTELAAKHVLDEKLAEYAFFPLAHIFNESKRAPVNVLELAVKCLQILVAEGWKTRLSPQMGKQLVILLTLMVGGAPGNANGNRTGDASSIELGVAGFNCLSAIFNVLSGPLAEQTIYHEIGTATVVDQTVYILLEAISGDKSDESCISAATALQALYLRVTDRVVLASIMPRTVSTLVKVLKPTTQVRRSYRLIIKCLDILHDMLKAVLNDKDNSELPEKSTQPQKTDERLVLDGSWLKATATQIKLALTQVIQLRRHERQEVQEGLLKLCIMVIEDCRTTLQESIPVLVETVVVLSELDENQSPNNAYSSLKHLATTYPTVLDSLKNSVHTWLTAFPRTMQGNDETAKHWAIKQITTAFQALSEIQAVSDLLTSNLTTGLCDSVAVIVNHATGTPQQLNTEPASQTMELDFKNRSSTFSPVLFDHKSQQQTLRDVQGMVARLNFSDSASDITRLIVSRIYCEQGNAVIAPLWLATTFLKSKSQLTSSFDEFISFDQLEPSRPYTSRASMIEELYAIALPVLNEPLVDDSRDWRISALALEAVALQAEELREAFRPELMDALYPVLQLLASNNQGLQRHAMTCLDILTKACNYADASTMIIENVDYLVNSVALKLNTFDVSPYPPQVLMMMVKLCGARLVPYLDDLVDSIFGILDLYHGYPKLVETMFKTLAAIVGVSTKSPSILAIENGASGNAPNHLKQKYQGLRISTLAEDIARRKARRAEYSDITGNNEVLSHPRRPWAEESKEKTEEEAPGMDNLSETLEQGESDEPLPPPREPEDAEKRLSKSHSLLLHIVKSLPSHLSSPSPYLRRSLLSILVDVIPVLAADENSFLPLINDLWPAVVSRITFPSSLNTPSSSSTALTPQTTTTPTKNLTDLDYQEETFVTTTACLAVETILISAGDFMTSRIEAEFPRWDRLYSRAWEKVRLDTDKVAERRAQKQQLARSTETAERTPSTSPTAAPGQGQGPNQEPVFIQSLSLTKPGSASGSRAFTPHHTLWRALISLFLTTLSHIRLPLPIGDRIAHILGEWVARYAGPTYYFSRRRIAQATTGKASSDELSMTTNTTHSHSEPIESAENVIRAMETWNPDLTWFVFQRLRSDELTEVKMKKRKDVHVQTGRQGQEQGQRDCRAGSLGSVSFAGGRIRFAEMIF
ncbi:armadillo-type protein [Aspergillus egyptiacus]|nr:armadillo-type protein [Aspergillus egyptiacus]